MKRRKLSIYPIEPNLQNTVALLYRPQACIPLCCIAAKFSPAEPNLPLPLQSPVKNGTPSLLSSFSSSSTSGSSSSSSSLVSMASIVGGVPVVPIGNSLIGSFSSAVQQHQHQTCQQQQAQAACQQQPPSSSQSKTPVPSSSTPSPPSHPLLPVSAAIPISSTPSLVALPQPLPSLGSGPSSSSLGLGLGLGLSKVGLTGTSSANQMSGLGLSGMPSALNTMAGLISASTATPYAQAAASGGLGLSGAGLSGISVESSTSIPTSGSSGVTTNGAGTGLSLLGSSPAHGSLAGGILGLVPGQNMAPGSMQVTPPPVSAAPGGAVGMLGGGGTGVGVIGGVVLNAAPARPPSGLKQNGSTSMCR